MKTQSAVALLLVGMVSGAELLPEHHDTLVRREHIHQDMQTEPVATTTNYFAASGKLMLTPDMWARTSAAQPYGSGAIVKYRVEGLPSGIEASIANFGGRNKARWQVLQVKDSHTGEWVGNYANAQEALIALELDIRLNAARSLPSGVAALQPPFKFNG